MPHNLTISSVIDKNKIASENVFLVLIEVDVKDHTGALVETVRIVKNSENIVHNGNTYTAANFGLDVKVEANQEPEVTLSAQDQTRTLAQYVEAYDGLVDNKVRMIVINSATPEDIEIQEEFLISGSSINNYIVELNLGVETTLSKRFPESRQFKDRCAWRYKGARCKYAGAMETCDYTREGPNGCKAHGNEINFGGFPGINELF